MKPDTPRDKLLEVNNLCIDFQTDAGPVRAVDHISFTIYRGEIVGLVGESGAGKSLTSEAILRLIRCPPGRLSGDIVYKGTNLLTLKDSQLAAIRGKEIAMIFQNPISSLNPVFRIGAQLLEAMTLHLPERRATLKEKVLSIVQRVGIPSADTRVNDYPHQFSGGMSQRTMIGMGISWDALSPKAKLRAMTRIALDGDMVNFVLEHQAPTSGENDTRVQVEIDEPLWSFHQKMVKEAQANRVAFFRALAELAHSLLSVVK